MESFAAVVEAFGGPSKFAAAMALSQVHARLMKHRDSIPPEYWPRLVEKAQEHGVKGVSYESLAKLAAAKRVPSHTTEAGSVAAE